MRLPTNLIHLKHYLIGDELIDCQHIDMVARLVENQQDVPKADLLKHGLEIYNMWRVHIQCEEDLMLAIAYPQVERHKQRHKEISGFCTSAISMVERSNQKIFDRHNAIANLKQTLMAHLDQDDQLLIPFIKAHRERKNETDNTA